MCCRVRGLSMSIVKVLVSLSTLAGEPKSAAWGAACQHDCGRKSPLVYSCSPDPMLDPTAWAAAVGFIAQAACKGCSPALQISLQNGILAAYPVWCACHSRHLHGQAWDNPLCTQACDRLEGQQHAHRHVQPLCSWCRAHLGPARTGVPAGAEYLSMNFATPASAAMRSRGPPRSPPASVLRGSSCLQHEHTEDVPGKCQLRCQLHLGSAGEVVGQAGCAPSQSSVLQVAHGPQLPADAARLSIVLAQALHQLVCVTSWWH